MSIGRFRSGVRLRETNDTRGGGRHPSFLAPDPRPHPDIVSSSWSILLFLIRLPPIPAQPADSCT
eukprot:6385627-Pyramimonas_sp.AAC.1